MEPDELRYREFRRSVRGYNPDEVDDLLDAAAGELDRLSGELEEARSKIEHYEGIEASIRSTLEQAEKAAEDYREAARREAALIVREAEDRSRRMLADSSDKAERVRGSYEALRQTRHAFDADFRRLLQGYLRLLDEAGSATSGIESPPDERLDHEAIFAAREAAEEERTLEEEPGGDPEAQEDSADPEQTPEPEEDTGDEAGGSSGGRSLRRRG